VPPAPSRQTNPAPQESPLPGLAQQRWPRPPHDVQTLFAPHRVYGAVHSTSPTQHGWPKPPHVAQLPLLQVPSVPGQAVPEPMQRRVSWLQQPPPLHVVPSQHGSPGPPHATHFVLFPHVRPEAVQKEAALLLPGRQQFWPAPPHAVLPAPPVEQLPPLHVPRMPPHAPALATHWPATQQAPVVLHVSPPQHG
jgi:hypothetical protein